MNAEQRHAKLRLSLPISPCAVANNARFKKAGGFICLSGQPPILSDGSRLTGDADADATTAKAYEQAKFGSFGHLSAMKETAGSLDKIDVIKDMANEKVHCVKWTLA